MSDLIALAQDPGHLLLSHTPLPSATVYQMCLLPIVVADDDELDVNVY